MKFLKKLKSSNFWVSMISAVVLILQAVFNVDIKTEYLNQIILGILGLLVMSGIVTDTNTDEVTVKSNVDLDGVKENINNILTQFTTSFETNLAGVLTKFEQLQTSNNIVKQTEKEVESSEIKVSENVDNSLNIELENVTETQQETQIINTVTPTEQNSDNLNVL